MLTCDVNQAISVVTVPKQPKSATMWLPSSMGIGTMFVPVVTTSPASRPMLCERSSRAVAPFADESYFISSPSIHSLSGGASHVSKPRPMRRT